MEREALEGVCLASSSIERLGRIHALETSPVSRMSSYRVPVSGTMDLAGPAKGSHNHHCLQRPITKSHRIAARQAMTGWQLPFLLASSRPEGAISWAQYAALSEQ